MKINTSAPRLFLQRWLLLALLFAIPLINGCSGSGSGSDSAISASTDYIYESKAQPIAMEADLQADESLALTTERNVALFLTDPDNQIDSRSFFSDAEMRAREAMKNVPVHIEDSGTYDICNLHPPESDSRLHTLVFDASGNELLSVMDEGCKSIDLPSGEFQLKVGTVANDLQDSHEWPAFLTMENNRIRILFNGCPSCDLAGLDLRNRTLKGTDFNHANLEGRLTENTHLVHVIGDGSNILTGRHFDDIGQDDYNRSLADVHPTDNASISRGVLQDVRHAMSHPVDTAMTVVHKGEDVVHKIVEYTDSAGLSALLTILSPFMDEGLPKDADVLSHKFAKSISAMTRPVPAGALPKVIGFEEVDHTYLEINMYANDYHDELETLAFGAFGENTGGSELNGTLADCGTDSNHSCIDTLTVAFMMEKNPCKWPVTTGYARVGVCWNLANRGLYYTGKTVKNVPYYLVIETAYGTYGAMGVYGAGGFGDLTAPYTMSKCLDVQQSQQPWDGYDFGVPFNGNYFNLRSVSPSPELPDDIDPRIRLFQEYYADDASITRSVENGARDFNYLQALLQLNVEEKLGATDGQTMDALLKIHASYLPELSALRTASDIDYTALNELMNAQLAEYREVLGEERYLKLMGLEVPEPFDMQQHAPQTL